VEADHHQEEAIMDRTDLTARIAYALFEHRGRVPGREHDDWLFAERLMEWCAEAQRKEVKRPEPKRALPRAAARGALDLLAEAVERDGRAAASAALGYTSTSVVSALLRGRRALDQGLADRIVAAFGGDGATLTLRTGGQKRRAG
jgi:hypothetical protein